MTRSDVMASSRPRKAGTALNRRGSRRAVRGLLALPILLLALALVMPGVAAAETYTETATKPATTPAAGTAPTTETTAPTTSTAAKETAPATTSTTPTTSEKATTLPFTGFDLRWDVGFGLLLMGAGLSIVLVQRRQRKR